MPKDEVAQYKPVVKSFQHGVEASTDVRIQALRRAFDNDGYAVYWTLVERVYANGGELRLRHPEMVQEVARLCWVTMERLKEIIEWCCEVGLFSKSTWVHRKIVTSKGIKADIEQVLKRKEQLRRQREKDGIKAKAEAMEEGEVEGVKAEDEEGEVN